MGLLTGRATFLRYAVDGPPPAAFGPEHLEQLATFAIGQQKVAAKDATEVGWLAGEDILDLGFDLAKNVLSGALHFAFRVDSQKLPGELLRAYAREELHVLAVENPSGRPSTKQKKEAREAARVRLESEAKDGRYTRRKAYPVLWDGEANQLLVGTTSPGTLDRVQNHFRETFSRGLTLLDAGVIATQQASQRSADLTPSMFVPGGGLAEVAWVKDPVSPGYLGNEFLLWLWFVLETEGDGIALTDDSEVTVMLTQTLALECPRGQSGSETMRSEAPTKLPEARRAIQAGKLPRQTGLILVRHDQQYVLTLQAETLAIRGAKLPHVEAGDERVKVEDRVGQLRHLVETVELLYAAFLRRRLGTDWSNELERMQRWLQRDERSRLAATA